MTTIGWKIGFGLLFVYILGILLSIFVPIFSFSFVFSLIVVSLFVLLAIAKFEIITEYERGAYFVLGKYRGILRPGIYLIFRGLERIVKVDLRITTVDISKQEVITKDNVPLYINGVVYCKVEDPEKAVLNIKDYLYAVSSYSQTVLRDILGNFTLDEVLEKREEIAKKIREIVDQEASNWGVDITIVKLQDISLPENLKRAMARQAEAERERKASIIKSQGEKQAARNIADAAKVIASVPGALHIRTLHTLADIASDPSQKIVIVLPSQFEDLVSRKKKRK